MDFSKTDKGKIPQKAKKREMLRLQKDSNTDRFSKLENMLDGTCI